MIIISKTPVVTPKVITTSPTNIISSEDNAHHVGVRKNITKKGGVRTIKK